MLRKVISATLVAMLSVLGLNAASPANAVDGFSPAVNIGTSVSDYRVVEALNDQTAVVASVSYENGIVYLRTHKIGLDGALTAESVIDARATGNFSIPILNSDSLAVDSNGTMALTWTVNFFDELSNRYGSKVFVAYTEDGSDWSNPVEVFEITERTEMNCFMMMDFRCGFNRASVLVDGVGRFAFIARSTTAYEASILARTTWDGVLFSATSTLYASGFQGPQPVLLDTASLDGSGYIAIWGVAESSGVNVRLYSSSMNSATRSYWSKPTYFDSMPNYGWLLSVGQVAANKFVAYYDDGVTNAMTIVRRTYSAVSKTWSEATELAATVNASGIAESFKTAYRNGKFVGTFNYAFYGQSTSHPFMEVSTDGSTFTERELAASSDNNISPFDLMVAKDSTVLAGWSWQYVAPYLAHYKNDGTNTFTEIPTTLGNAHITGAISDNGNVFMIADFYDSSTKRSIAYVQASAPTHSGTPAVRGTAKNGAKLTAGTLLFSSISGVSANTFQWYACTRAVPTNTTALPAGCVAIAKATASTFKVTTKQKGKFITVAVKNTNAVGTTTIFAPVATKSK